MSQITADLATHRNAVPCPPTRRLAAWMSAGMLDWPGKVSATLFLAGCDLRCPYCHNPELKSVREDSGRWPALADYLERRRSWVDGVVITGGEPTYDPDLIALLEDLRDRSIPVKLDTNGIRPDVLSAVLRRRLADYVALDVKTLPDRYTELGGPPDAEERIRESIRLVRRSRCEHEFRTTCYPGLVGLDDLPAIARLLGGGRLWVLQQFRPGETLDPGASLVPPHKSTALLDAAEAASHLLPTVTRGV